MNENIPSDPIKNRYQFRLSGLVFWGKWVLASIGGQVFGFVLAILLVIVVDRVFADESLNAVGIFMMFPAIGFSVGVSQALILEPILSRLGAAWWAAGTGVGWTLGMPLTFVLSRTIPSSVITIEAEIFTGVLQRALFGALLGLIQWVAVRGEIPKSGWLVLGSMISWVFALLLTGPGSLVDLKGVFIVGGISGAVMGLVWVFLLRESLTERELGENG